MTKKEIKKKNALKRVTNGFNTGTRTMKSAKDYKRVRIDLRKEEYNV